MCIFGRSMSSYGIRKLFPTWNNSKIRKLLDNLENIGVDSEDDLKLVTFENLTEKCGLREIQAKKLLEYWGKKYGSYLFLLKFYFLRENKQLVDIGFA